MDLVVENISSRYKEICSDKYALSGCLQNCIFDAKKGFSFLFFKSVFFLLNDLLDKLKPKAISGEIFDDFSNQVICNADVPMYIRLHFLRDCLQKVRYIL